MNGLKQELGQVKGFLANHRIVIYGMLLVLMILSYGMITLLRQQNSSTTTDTKSNSQKSAIAPQTSYANPFDKKSQYTNPFSEYKNPFDTLK